MFLQRRLLSSTTAIILMRSPVCVRSFASSSSSSTEGGEAKAPASDAQQGKFIRIERNGPVAELVMARPKALNSVGEGFFAELKDAINWVDSERDVRAAILRADGKIFCAGLDLKEAQDLFGKGISTIEKVKVATTVLGSKLMNKSPSPKPTENGPPAQRNQELFRMMQRWHKSINMMRSSRVPIIAAVHNKCIGAGVDLICACDIRYCTADAEFSMKQTKMAIVPDLGTLQFISKLIGSGQARELAFTGRDFSSTEAMQMGFINRVFENEAELLAGARKLAAEIAANSPLAVQGAKYILNYAEEHNIGDGLDQMAMWNAAFLKSDDLFAAIAGFATKTKPKFSNTMAPPPQ